jgi:periplasmic divalent cation tolerance protein
MTGAVVGFVTCSSPAEARKIAGAILGKKLAACVNVLPGVESHYRWRGRLERSRECLLVIKTTRARTAALMRLVKSVHSYEVPEIIFVPVSKGEAKYMKWLRNAVMALALLVGVAAFAVDKIDTLIGQLGDTNDEVRAEAADGLARIGGTRVEKQFREMLASGSPEHRQMAAVGLLQISDAGSDLELVRARLKDENATVRWSAAVALGQSARSEAIPWLDEAGKTDASDSVREAATEAAGKLRSSILWARELPAALKRARSLGKPVLAYFFVRGSAYCRQFEEGVLADAEVVSAAQEFVPVRVSAAANAAEAQKYDVRGAPTVLVLDGDGNEMTRVTGLAEKATLVARLADARRGKLTFREAKRRAARDPSDVPANWKVAEIFLEEGREDLAEPHLRNVVGHDEENRYGYTDDALFALGFALGKRGEHAQAVYCLEKLQARWPQYKDRDKALYCLGLSQLALGQKEIGRNTLATLLHEFPDKAVAKNAQRALEKLDATRP